MPAMLSRLCGTSNGDKLVAFGGGLAGNGGATGIGYRVDPLRFDGLYYQDWVIRYRPVVGLADINNSLFMRTTGQSGNVFSGHHDYLIERHRDVEYLPMTFGRDHVAGSILHLAPQ